MYFLKWFSKIRSRGTCRSRGTFLYCVYQNPNHPSCIFEMVFKNPQSRNMPQWSQGGAGVPGMKIYIMEYIYNYIYNYISKCGFIFTYFHICTAGVTCKSYCTTIRNCGVIAMGCFRSANHRYRNSVNLIVNTWNLS